MAEMAPFHFASGYGLFRTMTTERPEILIEGSDDGTQWIAYDFVWKVDEISDAPKFVAPHQPRVAWQFWFAALEGRFDYQSRNATWIEALVLKLLDGDSDVQATPQERPLSRGPRQNLSEPGCFATNLPPPTNVIKRETGGSGPSSENICLP